MAITLVSGAVVGASSVAGANITSSPIDSTGGTAIFAVLATYSTGGTPSFSDNKGNTYTSLTGTTAADVQVTLWYVLNATVGTGHTFTGGVVSGTSYPSLNVAVFAGVATASAFDQENGAGTTGSPPLSPGSITPGFDDELVIAGVGCGGAGTITIDDGFTITTQQNYTANNFGSALAYLIQTSAAAVGPDFGGFSGLSTAARIASFRMVGTSVAHGLVGGGLISGGLVGGRLIA